MIPIARPSIGSEELKEVEKVFSSGWLGMGSVVFDFENKIKDYIGVKHAIAVNSGTSAIHIALDAVGIGQLDEVLVPSLTFVGSIQPIIACGAKPVFCEVDKDTMNIDVGDVKKKITDKTKAIIPVHYGGEPCQMDELLDLARGKNIHIIEDAAHAFGSLYKGKRIGSFADITCFSFDPIKNITCGEGGAVVTNDEKIAQDVIRKRILGIDKDTWHRYKNERSWFYEVVTSGFRYHMSNINAAIGIVQMGKLEGFIEKKRNICHIYDNAFKDIKGIDLLARNYENIAPFSYVVKIKNRRDEFLQYLNENGVGAGIQYIPNHLQPRFKEFHTSPLRVTEDVYKQILALPLYPDMQDHDISKVIDTVTGYFSK